MFVGIFKQQTNVYECHRPSSSCWKLTPNDFHSLLGLSALTLFEKMKMFHQRLAQELWVRVISNSIYGNNLRDNYERKIFQSLLGYKYVYYVYRVNSHELSPACKISPSVDCRRVTEVTLQSPQWPMFD